MGQQSDTLTGGWQVVKSAHGHIHFVAHTVAIHQHLGRIFFTQNAS
jgi:hypothetical protein